MPAFVEERALFIRERMNNHYGPFLYSLSNFLSSLPWIFLISLLSSTLIYSMIQSRTGGDHFGIYLANLFVALVAAESMMVAISAVSYVYDWVSGRRWDVRTLYGQLLLIFLHMRARTGAKAN